MASLPGSNAPTRPRHETTSQGTDPPHSEMSGDVAVEVTVQSEADRKDLATKPNPSFFAIYQRIYRLATFKERILYGIGIICCMASGTILPLMTLIFGHFVTVFTDFALGQVDGDTFRGKINHYTLYFVYLFIARASLTYASMVLFSIVASNVTAALRKLYLHVVLHQRLEYHETFLSSGTVSLALSTHSNAIRSGLAEKFGLGLKSASTVVTAFVVAFTTQWKLGLVTATIIPAAVLAVGVTSAFGEEKEQALNEVKAKAATVAEEVVSSMRTVRALGAEERLLDKYHTCLKIATQIGWKRMPINGIQTGSYMFAIYGGYALAFWYGIRLYAKGEVKTAGSVIATLFSIMIGVHSFAELAAYLGPFMRISTAGAEVFTVIDSTVTTPPSTGGTSTANEKSAFLQSGEMPDFKGQIEFEDVSFEYPTRPGFRALDGFSLSIPAGKTTALVGPSGSGKSTVISLLIRWYDVSEGNLSFGGREGKNIPLETLRDNVGFVGQEPCLFSGTVSENIEYGLTGSRFTGISSQEKRELVIEACKLSNAHDFITKLPQGYGTPIGNRGTLLSGGQKQRLAIARAVVKDPPILILDEATSALDVNSEAIVQHALEKVQNNRTTIVIAHRLSTVRRADQIVAMRRGTVVECGTHDELLTIEDGLYRRLWTAQELAKGGVWTAERQGEFGEDDFHQDVSIAGNRRSSPQEMRQTDLRSQSGAFRTFLDLLRNERRYWSALGLLTIAAGIGGALFPVQAFLYAKVVTAFQLTEPALTSRGDFWALMWFILAIVVAMAYFWIGGLSVGLGEAISQDYRLTYFRGMMAQSMAFFDSSENSPSNLLARLSTDPDSINSLAGDNIGVMVTVGVSLISTIALALAVGWKLGLVVVSGGLPLIFGAGVVHERMENSFEEQAGKVFVDSVGFAGECIQAIKTVSALNMEPFIEDRFGSLLSEHCQRAVRYVLVAMIWFALSDAIDFLCMALAFWYGGRLISFHEYSVMQFFIVFIAIIFGSQSMGQFFAHSTDISKGVSGANAIASLEKQGLKDISSHEVVPSSEICAVDLPLIEFRNACFAYPARPDHLVLKNFNLKIYTGQTIALVGPSGCGKSTVIQLLERFYELTSGDLVIRGVPVARLATKEIRQMLALVSQEPVLYQGSIEENIRLGTKIPLSSTMLEEVTRQAQLEDVISSLPEGMATPVGWRGTALSGGQKQRVAIARAIAQEAPILLLDEATSALDSESEQLIQKALQEGSQGKTVIAVAHRLSTIQHADSIFVLQEGQIVETGRHADLVGRKGVYWRMIQGQMGEIPA